MMSLTNDIKHQIFNELQNCLNSIERADVLMKEHVINIK